MKKNIYFKSLYGPKEGQRTKIEFKSEVDITNENGFIVLTFDEKRDNVTIKNRFEFNENQLTIFSGPSTLNFELNKVIKNNFVIENQYLFIYSKLIQTKINPNQDEFEFLYIISTNEEMSDPTYFNLTIKIN